jgi:RNA polymerase sigma-70 factor, ECF subfamily
MDEQTAIDLCLRHRDPAGFEQLVRMFRREAYMHAIAFLGNEQDAADACQDSFARAFAAMPKLQTLQKFYPWFYTILRNCCLNQIARRKTAAEYQARTQQEEAEQSSGELSPALLLERNEEQQAVWQTLAALEANDREILALKHIQGRQRGPARRTSGN